MSDTLSRPATSLEWVKVPVNASEAGAPIDPTVDAVALAFLATSTGDPVDADWVEDSDWETYAGVHYARCLVGPGGAIELAAGRYRVFVKITDSPEAPQRYAGRLHLT